MTKKEARFAQELKELKNKKAIIKQQEEELQRQEQALEEQEAQLEYEITLKEQEMEESMEEESIRHVIFPAFVGHFFRLMNSFYDHLVKTHPHLSYRAFCHYLSLRFRFCKSYEIDRYLSPTTVLSYFKKERAGEYYRV